MNIADRVTSYTWRPWAQRNYQAFAASLVGAGGSEEDFASAGILGVSCKAVLYQKGFFYESDEVFRLLADSLMPYVKNRQVLDLADEVESFRQKSLSEIRELHDQDNAIEALAGFNEIFRRIAVYVWLAHGLERTYDRILKQEVPKFIADDIDTFIGDASLPSRKHAHARMEEKMRNGESSKKIAEEFGWLSSRDGFSDPFSEKDIDDMRASLKEEEPTKPGIY